MKAVFWSNGHGQGKQTANLIAVCQIMAHMYETTMLITQTHYTQNDLEEAALGRLRSRQQREEFYQDGGIDALLRTFKQGPLTENAVAECCISLLESRKFHLLPGSQNGNRITFDEIMDTMLLSVLDKAEAFYDLVIIDANPGRNELSQKLLEQADVILVNLSQNRGMIDDFMENYKELSIDKRVFFLFGGYIQESKYNRNNLIRRYPAFHRKNTGVIPFCTGYMDALSSGETKDFFERNVEAGHGEENFWFIQELTKTAKKIYRILTKAAEKKESPPEDNTEQWNEAKQEARSEVWLDRKPTEKPDAGEAGMTGRKGSHGTVD